MTPDQKDNAINICHISTLTGWGGVETRLVEYLEHRKNQTLNHFVIATSAVDEVKRKILELGIEVFIPIRRFHYDPLAIFQMAQWMQERDIHITHSRNWTSNTWGGMASLIAKIPLRIAGEHGTVYVEGPPRSWIENLFFRNSSMIIANSFASKKMLTWKRRLLPDKIRVIYDGIAPLPNADVNQIRSQWGIPNNVSLIGTVGRLDTPKDHFTFIKAARQILLQGLNVYFIIVGGGPLENELRIFIQSLDIPENRIILTGWRSDARRIIQSFDIYVSTSTRESLGNTIIEAGLAQKPIIAPSIDGITELISDARNGILLIPTEPVVKPQTPSASQNPAMVLINGKPSPPKSLDPKLLAEKTLFLLNNPVRAKSLGLVAKKDMQRLFSIVRYTQEIEAIYLEKFPLNDV